MSPKPQQILTATWWSMALMVFTMITAMASQKTLGVDQISVNGAWLLTPFLLIIPAVLTWRYGARYATTIVHSNAVALVLAMLAIKIAIVVPADASWNGQAAYATVLTFSWRAIITLTASIWLGSWLMVLLTRTVHQGQTTESSLQGLFPIVAMLFVMSLLVSNITTQKIAHLFGAHRFAITVDVGTLFFPLTYIFNNIFTEVYGYKRSRILIWGGLLGNLLMTLLLQIWVWLPGATDWHHQAAYADIFGTVPRIVLASTMAFFGGEFVNSLCLAKLKILTSGRYLWTRTIGSTVVGVAVDSLAFSAIAFIGVVPLIVVLSIAAWEYAMKVGYEVLATPLTVTIIAWFKRREHCDRYDYQTRFNPFRIADIHYHHQQSTL